jgi:hypothetical protein
MAQIAQVTAAGEAHGLVDVRTNAVVDDGFKHMDPKIKAIVEKEKKEDAKIVEVEYINRTGRHERLTKPYCKYPGDPIQMWNFIPGQRYKVPMGLVNEVNKARMPKRSGLMEVDGEKVQASGAPLDKDMDGDWIHKFIPVSF